MIHMNLASVAGGAAEVPSLHALIKAHTHHTHRDNLS